MTNSEKALIHNALGLAKKALMKITLHAPGYDWNGDPLNLTLIMGEADQLINQALPLVEPDLGTLAALSAPKAPAGQPIIEAATELLDAMETCHICKGALILEESPIHCENCPSDCENHDEPECTPIYVLHAKLRKALKREAPAPAPLDLEFKQAIESLLEWVPSCSKGSSGYMRVEKVRALLKSLGEGGSLNGSCRQEASRESDTGGEIS